MGLYITGTFQTFFKCKLVKMYVCYGEIYGRQIDRERKIYIAPSSNLYQNGQVWDSWRCGSCLRWHRSVVGFSYSSSVYIVYVCICIVIIVFIRFTFIVKCTIRQVKSLSMKYYCVYRKALTIKHCNCRSLFSLLLYHHLLFYINANSGNIGKLLDCDRRYERVLS